MLIAHKESLVKELRQDLENHRGQLFVVDRETNRTHSTCIGVITSQYPYLDVYEEGFSLYSAFFDALLHNEPPRLYHKGGTIGPLTPMFTKLEDLIGEGSARLRVYVGTRRVLGVGQRDDRLRKPIQDIYRYSRIHSLLGTP